jgi:hypothetical protein
MDQYRLLIHPAVLGAGERIFLAPLTIEPMSTTVFSGGAVAHVFAGHPVIEPDRQPGSGRCHLAAAMAEHARPMTHMLRASRRAARLTLKV